ncbi:MATE family efflux transporter [Oricola thermophila]|uniref:MATE family efflux transporter n=1 Tax=Oricola thermophila TaxID=2742145 RepID=A0A6N1VF31_9HYPH|nr:MATE family efflux transporter [Oricola thermophila]QKV19328.1 MATE family efflux transporter [Oricola thermophila]
MTAASRSDGAPFEVTNRMVFAIAAPMTLAFLTTPILGIVDTTVIGQFGDAALIGGLAVGAIVFDIVFTTLNFLRSGTTGFVAQAFGRGDETEQQAVFWRAVILAAGLGLALLALAWPIRELGIALMNPGPEVAEATRTYVTVRMFAAPFSLVNYAILGLLLGQGRAMAALLLQTLLNGINIAGSIYFGLVLGWAIEGVAFGTILGEATAAAAGFWWIMRGFDRARAPSWSRVFGRAAFLRLVSVNRDIMIRSFALLAGFSLFTRTGAQFGAVTLAANAILMNFFMVASYYLDGLATAAEQIAGRAVGARHAPAFWRAVKLTCLWGFVLAGVSTVVILAAGGPVIDFMTTAEPVRAAARSYLPWAAATALMGVLAFEMDGVYIGATWSRDMRNMMLASLALFFALLWLLVPVFGNHGLWFALNAFLGARGLTLLAILPGRAGKVFG